MLIEAIREYISGCFLFWKGCGKYGNISNEIKNPFLGLAIYRLYGSTIDLLEQDIIS